jgi:competence protein ComEC
MGTQVPFFRLLIPFVCGIILALAVELQLSSLQAIILLSSLFIILVVLLVIRLSWANRWVFGLAVFLFLLAAGFSLTHLTQSESDLEHEGEFSVVARILDTPEVRLSSTRVLVRIEMIKSNEEWQSVSEKSLLYFSASDSVAQYLEFGNLLAFKANFTTPPQAKNPNQFNYAKYLSKKGVHRVAFVPAQSWMVVGHMPHWLFSKSFGLRERLLSLFQRVGVEGENLAVLSALTMGYKSLLDQETRRVFSASGAMHILAVSGLHVGILFTTLSAFLFFLDRVKRGKYLKAIVLIIFLWFFAAFTGLSPSVLRAALMFTLVIIGTSFRYQTNIYNTLSASAFVILVANPMLITEVGFQLSYLAVLSIVFFYPHIYNLLYVQNRWIDKVWVLISVSLAAQLGTFVLGLFYFNQFPNYFLLTNLYAIPMAFVVLYLTIGLLFFSPIPMVSSALGWLLNESLSLLNSLIRFTESLPYSTSTGISISSSQALALLFAILMLALFLEFRKSYYINLLLGALLIFFAERAYDYSVLSRQSELVFFADRQESLIGIRNGRNIHICTADTTSGLKTSDFSFTLDGYINRIGAGQNQPVIPFNELSLQQPNRMQRFSSRTNELGHWLSFNNYLIFIPTPSDHIKIISPHKLYVDLMLVNRASASDIKQLFDVINPGLVVVDDTVPPWQLTTIRNETKLRSLKLYSIAEQGALIL